MIQTVPHGYQFIDHYYLYYVFTYVYIYIYIYIYIYVFCNEMQPRPSIYLKGKDSIV